MAAHKTADLRTRYWDWTERGGAEHYQKYYGTPPDICRSACARRWTSSSPRGWRRGSAATGCWPRRCAPRLQSDARAAQSTSTSRSEEHTSVLQSIMRISYAVFFLN